MQESRFERFERAIDGWEPAIALVAVIGLLLLGFFFQRIGKGEAFTVGFLSPMVVLVVLGMGLRSHRGVLLVLGIAVCVAALWASEEQVSERLLPKAAIAHAGLRPGEALNLAEDVPKNVRVEVHGKIHVRSAEAHYRLELTRAQRAIGVDGVISRKVRRTRKGTRTNVHLTDTHDVSLQGTGPARVTLLNSDASLDLPLLIEVREAPTHSALARWLLIACLGIAALLEAWSARRGGRVRLAMAVGIIAAFSEFVAASYNPDSPLKFMLAALLLGLIGGGIGGWAIGALTTAVLGRGPAIENDSAAQSYS